MDFYHCRMDVYTHFQHTFMFKQLVKVNLASDDPFRINTSQTKVKTHIGEYLKMCKILFYGCFMVNAWFWESSAVIKSQKLPFKYINIFSPTRYMFVARVYKFVVSKTASWGLNQTHQVAWFQQTRLRYVILFQAFVSKHYKIRC